MPMNQIRECHCSFNFYSKRLDFIHSSNKLKKTFVVFVSRLFSSQPALQRQKKTHHIIPQKTLVYFLMVNLLFSSWAACASREKISAENFVTSPGSVLKLRIMTYHLECEQSHICIFFQTLKSFDSVCYKPLIC